MHDMRFNPALSSPFPDAKAVFALRRLPAGLEARISGPIDSFLGLVSGACSTDALFFFRDPAVEGDIEVALALRNMIDDSEIALSLEIAMLLGPTELQPLVRDALASLYGEMLTVPEDARPLARVTAALFDAYRDKVDPRYSRVI